MQKNISIFTHEFRLKTNKYQKRKLFIKFRALRELYNMVLGEILKRNRKMLKDPKFIIALSLYRNEKTKKEGSALLNELNKEYFLLKSNLQSFATQAKNSSYMVNHLDGDTVQVISDRAYNAYMNYKFGKFNK